MTAISIIDDNSMFVLYTSLTEAVCSKIEPTEFYSNSLLLKILPLGYSPIIRFIAAIIRSCLAVGPF